jgi:predicted TPR repeat methyltransferase
MNTPTTPQVISVDEAMTLVIECLKDGRVRDAGALCRRVLEVSPGHPSALHYAGKLACKAGHTAEAIALMEDSLERVPDQADWHSNLGIVRQAAGDLEGAFRAFQRAIELDPAHVNGHNNLGVLHRVFGRLAESEAAYRTAITLDPNNANAYQNLAIVLDLMDRTPEAVVAYCKALTLQPHYPEAQRRLALAYCTLGERDKAVSVCEAWLARNPDDPHARHTLAAVSGRDVPPRASDGYVQAVFDSFADTFESKLARLYYRAPELVAAALDSSGLAANGSLDVLDVGCGTGLCGPLLAPYKRRLVGVDLSQGMLERARDKGIYDELVHAELTAYLQRMSGAFDVIVSADTLVYVGALEAVADAAAAALRPGGVLVFTLEEAVADDSGSTYAIQPHGRYTHHAAYVSGLLAGAGLRVTIDRAELRKESGAPVAGLVVSAVKPGGTSMEGGAGQGASVGGPHA